jgi:hypothetical protein
MVRRTVALFLTIGLTLSTTVLALEWKQAMYVGGTLTSQIPEKTEGVLDTTSSEKLIFFADKGKASRSFRTRRSTPLSTGRRPVTGSRRQSS